MRKSLHCSICDARLTAPLDIRSSKDPAVAMPDVVDRKPLVPQGVAFKSWKPPHWIYMEPGHPLHSMPQYWINPDDVANVVRNSRHHSRLTGCCGIAGMNGPNQICRCEADVGTLQDDCMTPRVFIPEPGNTHWIEAT